ncbi:hypothetical protein ACIQVE_02025 [Pseudomonas sp. NPDC098747]|uniref:hypothetical protein n=1 Tax=Pseudomonas sp. NPDC098747 TaxID=3364487 RepID=UPI00383BC138
MRTANPAFDPQYAAEIGAALNEWLHCPYPPQDLTQWVRTSLDQFELVRQNLPELSAEHERDMLRELYREWVEASDIR